MKKIFASFRAFAVEIVLRKALIPVVLTLTYIFAIGPSSVFARIFVRNRLYGVKKNDLTWWRIVEIQDDPDKCLRQS